MMWEHPRKRRMKTDHTHSQTHDTVFLLLDYCVLYLYYNNLTVSNYIIIYNYI